MTQDCKVPMIVQMATEVLDMHYKLERLREENEELQQYRKKHGELLNSVIVHNDRMMQNTVHAHLTIKSPPELHRLVNL
jgi:hypothetical protein